MAGENVKLYRFFRPHLWHSWSFLQLNFHVFKTGLICRYRIYSIAFMMIAIYLESKFHENYCCGEREEVIWGCQLFHSSFNFKNIKNQSVWFVEREPWACMFLIFMVSVDSLYIFTVTSSPTPLKLFYTRTMCTPLSIIYSIEKVCYWIAVSFAI